MGAHQRGIVEELEKAHIYIEQLSRNNSKLERKNKELEERLVKLEALLGDRATGAKPAVDSRRR